MEQEENDGLARRSERSERTVGMNDARNVGANGGRGSGKEVPVSSNF